MQSELHQNAEWSANWPRTGVDSRFPKVSAFLKRWVSSPLGIEDDRLLLQRYVTEAYFETQSSMTDKSWPYETSSAAHSLNRLGLDYMRVAMKGRLGTDVTAITIEQQDWRRALAYLYWSFRLYYRFHLHALHEWNTGVTSRRIKLTMLFLTSEVWVDAACYLSGWNHCFQAMHRRVLDALDKELYNDGRSIDANRGQMFTLRLLSSAINVDYAWPDWVHDIEAYEFLYENRLSSNFSVLRPAILVALDRHTYESRNNTNKKSHDFASREMHYFPFEILTLLKLRADLGLVNEALDHPLMATPLGRWPPLPPLAEYGDELIDAVIAKARLEFADL